MAPIQPLDVAQPQIKTTTFLSPKNAFIYSPHNWLMSLAMDLAALCYVEVKMTPMDAIWLFLVKV